MVQDVRALARCTKLQSYQARLGFLRAHEGKRRNTAHASTRRPPCASVLCRRECQTPDCGLRIWDAGRPANYVGISVLAPPDSRLENRIEGWSPRGDPQPEQRSVGTRTIIGRVCCDTTGRRTSCARCMTCRCRNCFFAPRPRTAATTIPRLSKAAPCSASRPGSARKTAPTAHSQPGTKRMSKPKVCSA